MGDISANFTSLASMRRGCKLREQLAKVGEVEDTSGLAIPKEIPFPEQWLPKRTSTERPPLELLMKWEAQAGDDIDAPVPTSSEPHADCVVCQKMHGPPPCEGPAQS
ncbi:hypothetical protein Dimus_003097 [Dionaea muscipula]